MRYIDLFEAPAGWDVIDDSGPPHPEMDAAVPVNAAKVRISRHIGGSPIVRYWQDAAQIEKILPPPKPGLTRLWRGNRPGEIGHNPSFTNDLAGIALPFRERYGGDISYVDVPTTDLNKYLLRHGVAQGAEFALPMDLAKQARRVAVMAEAKRAKSKR